jgi:hypothetical protein
MEEEVEEEEEKDFFVLYSSCPWVIGVCMGNRELVNRGWKGMGGGTDSISWVV